MARIIVTGGAGFVGSALVRYLVCEKGHMVLNIDKLTYSGSHLSVKDIEGFPQYHFLRADICDRNSVSQAFHEFQPEFVMHLAAESHVDRSIDEPDIFIHTNVVGTGSLLEVVRQYFASLSLEKRNVFRFLHISTDEVFGSLSTAGLFSEDTRYDPRSPYSASKAASDHLVRAWGHTYKLPVLITNCSNNYGPFQFPEKLVPAVISNALKERPIPVYGDGLNVRDWLYVEDHVRALVTVVERGICGETYLISGKNEKTNIEMVTDICALLDELCPRPSGGPYADLIKFVRDRPGHDRRYAIDPAKIERELQWFPSWSFDQGILRTVEWFLANTAWCEGVSRNLPQ